MKTRSFLVALLSAGLLWSTAARAEPPVKVQNEINFLLGYIAGSGCEFYRNGSWYNAHEAHAHLRTKYNYLAASNLINTTEQFIEQGASKSSMSGMPYQIRCNGGAAVSSQQWLHGRLLELWAMK